MFTFFSALGGTAFVIFLMGLIYKRDAIHWEYLEQTYGRPWEPPMRERWGNAVLYGKFPVAKAYNGILKIGVHGDGLSLRIMFPIIALFCKPLFIPFHDLRGWDQTWYMDGKTIELELTGAPEVKIAMPREQVEWIREAGGREIKMMHQTSPHKDKPIIWHGFLIASSVIMLFGGGYILAATLQL